MPSHRIPIAIWEDYAGCFTARSLDGEIETATDASAHGAIKQLQSTLAWKYQKGLAYADVMMKDPALLVFKVAVRAAYETDDRKYPVERKHTLRMMCVVGKQSDQSLLCTIPMINLRFHCQSMRKAQQLATEYIQQELSGCRPEQLARCLMPKDVQLDTISVRFKEPRNANLEADDAVLRSVAEPLGDRSTRKRFSRAWGRDEEVLSLVNLIQSERPNIVLLGEGGSGKTTLLAEVVRKLEKRPKKKDVADTDEYHKLGHRFWVTSGQRLIAGMQYLGQWEARCEAVVDQLSSVSGTLCVESILGLIQSGGQQATSGIAAFFTPYLERNELRMIVEATPEEFEAAKRLLPAFASLFRVVRIKELSISEAHDVLRQMAQVAYQNTRVKIADQPIHTMVRLFKRFQPYNPFPGRCAAFMRELLEYAQQNDVPEINNEHVVTRFTKQTGIPAFLLQDDLPLDPQDTLLAFADRIYGQDAACHAAMRLVTTFKAGLNDPARPIGVHVYCGPTGVGKTELAKTLSKYLFGAGDGEDRMIRLDMSEYSGYGAAERLLTGSDGQPSDLVKRIRSQPFAVVLLDEIEKASPEVYDVLLNVFDEGRLTDRFGRTATFRSSVIVMTSNLGATNSQSIGFEGSPKRSYETELMTFFRPEFYNRFDEVVIFNPLSSETVREIAIKELHELGQREGLVRANLTLAWTNDIVELLAEQGFDARYGARPLQRTLERQVVAPLAKWLSENPVVTNTSIKVEQGRGGEVVVREA